MPSPISLETLHKQQNPRVPKKSAFEKKFAEITKKTFSMIGSGILFIVLLVAGIGIAVVVYNAIASLPVSVAIVIGAIIIESTLRS